MKEFFKYIHASGRGWRIVGLATRLLVDCYTHGVDVAMVKNCCVVGCKIYVGKKLKVYHIPGCNTRGAHLTVCR